MKTRPIQTSLILLILTFSGLFGIATAADAQEVHALLIILGNDRKIKESVAKNEEKMVNMLKQLSHHCNVKLTKMYSQSVDEGTISEKTFVNGRSEKSSTEEQKDIIHSRQVANWLENLNPNAEDTVLIYYNGHGAIGTFNTHYLIFDPGVNADNLDRGKLSQELKQKPARLRMLITDTCSNLSEDLSGTTFARYSIGVRAKARSYLQDLFLEHEGFLDITAASPGQFAIANHDLGGHFTSAMLSHGLTAAADTDKDNFLSWQEAFEETKAETIELYRQASFDPQMQRDLDANRQKTQEPYKHSLPTRIDGGNSSVPPQPPITTVVVGKGGAEMVLIPAGKFQMGSNHGDDDEKPVHTVHVNAFYMDIHEVTNAQYKRFLDANPQWRKDKIADRFHNGAYLKHWNGNNYPSGKANHPVVYVSWYAAMDYAKWAGNRLPTEAEWEKAARSGLAGKKYPWGDTIDSRKANYYDTVGDTTPVRSYMPNAYGLYDMSGNVWEWCLDTYKKDFYRVSPERNPICGGNIAWTMNNFTYIKSSRVLRGGSWAWSPLNGRVATRSLNAPSYASILVGFRCARTVSP